ncbi:endogenous retrovirus group PABLB member 1 Env polyprotein [Myotis lucifugus]|uniref:endogenous retrovirus group PABLB member 1 Env polyprotein n=1 Tax=Myotis lucifugus TaxID=59463 RepID=UPI000CCC0125|nr:endogenous retrovirus group PABLB member 1 Env polyprotein [Myotis lucifugus]
MWLADQDFGNASWDSVCQAIETLIQRDYGNAHPFIGYAVWNGWGWLIGEQVEFREPTDRYVEQQRSSKNHVVGWLPSNLCRNITINAEAQKCRNGKRYTGTKPADRMMPGFLWVCGRYGWPYLPANWSGRCTWGRPYILGRILKTLGEIPHNWDSVCHRWHPVKRTPWWFYPLAVFLPAAGTIKVELEGTALVEHTAKALNQTQQALTLMMGEMTRMQKVVLQKRMALDFLTAAECYVIELLKNQKPSDTNNLIVSFCEAIYKILSFNICNNMNGP